MCCRTASRSFHAGACIQNGVKKSAEAKDCCGRQNSVRACCQDVRREWAVSRVLSWTVIHLESMSPCSSSDLPGSTVGHGNASLFDLAPSGVYQPPNVTTDAVRSYRTLSPLPVATVSGDVGRDLGGLLSAALSVGSHPPGVTWRSALWSPDFPLHQNRHSDCLAYSRAVS